MNTPKPIAWNGPAVPPSSRRHKFPIASFASAALLAALLAGCKPGASANNSLKRLDTAASEPAPALSSQTQPQPEPVPQPNPVTNLEPAPTPQSIAVAPLTNAAPAPAVGAAIKKAARPAAGPGKEYVVNKGDTLFKIARANGVTVSALTQANPKLKDSKLKSGQKIQIPPASASTGIGFAEPGTGSTTGSANVHVVKAGETLTQIAKQHGTTVKALQSANQMKVTRVFVGQKIKLPAAAAAPHPDSGPAPATPPVTRVSDAGPALKP